MTGEPEVVPHHAELMTYSTPHDLPTVRAFVRDRATLRGLDPDRAELLVLAVSELTTNTLQHTTGGGRVVIWAEQGELTCDVIDRGPVQPLGRAMPGPRATGGRGLAIVESVCDKVMTFGSPDGAVTRLRFALLGP